MNQACWCTQSPVHSYGNPERTRRCLEHAQKAKTIGEQCVWHKSGLENKKCKVSTQRKRNVSHVLWVKWRICGASVAAVIPRDHYWLLLTLASVVVSEFIPGATACFPLTAKGAVCVNANLAGDAVVSANQTLVNIWGDRRRDKRNSLYSEPTALPFFYGKTCKTC